MQRAVLRAVTPIQFHSQATRVVTDHSASLQDEAVNDDVYETGVSVTQEAIRVIANVIGGALMLAGLLVMPHIIAGFLN